MVMSRQMQEWARRRAAVLLGEAEVVTPPAPEVSIFSPYTWSRALEAKSAGASSWTSEDGLTTLTASVAATLNQSTTGLTESNGIGASRSGKALRVGSAGFVSTANVSKPAGSLHVRALIRPDASVGSQNYLYHHRQDSTHQTFMYLTSSGLLYFGIANGTSQSAPTTAIALNAWHLVDVSYVPGTSLDVFVDGSSRLHRTDFTQDPVLSAPYNVGATYAGASPFVGTMLFLGRRYGSTVDLATHQADSHAVGLY